MSEETTINQKYLNENAVYPIGVQSFTDIREGGYLYVDKTQYIHTLKDGKFFFLSRPRRFGKSLLLSTIEAYFEGKRELFKGLALDSLTEEWEPHPVLHLDLNIGDYENPDELTAVLSNQLDVWERIYGVDEYSLDGGSPSIRFNRLIRRAYEQTGKKVVILIDEYDKPILNSIDAEERAEHFRKQLRAFYSNLKTMDSFIRFAMLTGVARFSKVSIFSDLNNLNDISFDIEFAAICGITSDELEQYFQPGIQKMARKFNQTEAEVCAELKRRYDGYHFAEISPDIYNPFSLLNAFAKSDIINHWFGSGTPDFLYRLMKKGHIPFRDLTPVEIEKNDLQTAGLLNSDPTVAFYQTGYLTIKAFDREFNSYILDYPNEEVKQAFLKFLLDSEIPDSVYRREFAIREFVRDVNAGRAESFMRRIESFIASIPYNEKGSGEAHYQNAVYLLFTLMGYYTRMEDRTSDGRIDIQVTTQNYIYIFEFKVDSSAVKAIEQIREKKYWLRDACSGKEIFLIGANFDTATRRLNDFIIEHP